MHLKSIIIAIVATLIIFLSFLFIKEVQQEKGSLVPIGNKFPINIFNSQTIIPPLIEFDLLKQEIKEKSGIYGLYIKNLETEETYEFNSEETFYGASLYKFPVAVAVMKEIENGKTSLETELTYEEDDFFEGAGSIQGAEFGSEYTVLDLLNKLLKESDNISLNILQRNISKNSVYDAFVFLKGDSLSKEFYVNNSTSPKEVGQIFENFIESDYLSEQNKHFLVDTMSNTFFDDRIYAGLDEDLVFAHKIGNKYEEGSWHDCGIVFNLESDDKVVVCVMSKDTKYTEFLDVSKQTGLFVSSF